MLAATDVASGAWDKPTDVANDNVVLTRRRHGRKSTSSSTWVGRRGRFLAAWAVCDGALAAANAVIAVENFIVVMVVNLAVAEKDVEAIVVEVEQKLKHE